MLGVVLIDYNSQERTVKYISDLLAASNVTIDSIVVIDNSPKDDNFDKIFSALCKIGLSEVKEANSTAYFGIKSITKGVLHNTVVLLANSSLNAGFAKANNLGLRILQDDAKQRNGALDLILFSNSDIQFIDGELDLKALITNLSENPDVAVIGPNVIGLNKAKQSPCKYLSIYKRWWRNSLLWPLDKLLKSSDEIVDLFQPGYVYRLIGAFMIADVEKFIEAGGFDENTFLFGEELILSERCKKKGYRMYCNPGVTIIHEGGYTVRKKKDAKSRNNKLLRMLESDLYYYDTYIGVKPAIIKLTQVIVQFYIFKMNFKDKIVCIARNGRE